jgi:hypothetical protein
MDSQAARNALHDAITVIRDAHRGEPDISALLVALEQCAFLVAFEVGLEDDFLKLMSERQA